MNALTVLIVLLVVVVLRMERLGPERSPLALWLRRTAPGTGETPSNLRAALVLLPPLLVAAGLGLALLRTPPVLSVPVGVVIALLGIGPVNPLARFDRACAALATGNRGEAERQARALAPPGLARGALDAPSVGGWFGLAVAERLVTPLLYIWLFGPATALALKAVWLARDPELLPNVPLRGVAEALWALLFFIPGRLFLLAAAFVGSFSHVVDVWQRPGRWRADRTAPLVADVALASARWGSFESPSVGAPELGWLRQVRALATRIMVLLAAAVLASLLV